MFSTLTMKDRGRLLTLYTLNTLEIEREFLMEVLEFETKTSLKIFLAKLEKLGFIIRENKHSQKFVNIKMNFTINQNYNYIYKLYKNNEVVYVGKTKNISNRISQHKKDKDFDYYDYVMLDDSKMHLYEIYYINKYKPIYNKEAKGDSNLNNTTLPELNFAKGGNTINEIHI